MRVRSGSSERRPVHYLPIVPVGVEVDLDVYPTEDVLKANDGAYDHVAFLVRGPVVELSSTRHILVLIIVSVDRVGDKIYRVLTSLKRDRM